MTSLPDNCSATSEKATSVHPVTPPDSWPPSWIFFPIFIWDYSNTARQRQTFLPQELPAERVILDKLSYSGVQPAVAEIPSYRHALADDRLSVIFRPPRSRSCAHRQWLEKGLSETYWVQVWCCARASAVGNQPFTYLCGCSDDKLVYWSRKWSKFTVAVLSFRTTVLLRLLGASCRPFSSCSVGHDGKCYLGQAVWEKTWVWLCHFWTSALRQNAGP